MEVVKSLFSAYSLIPPLLMPNAEIVTGVLRFMRAKRELDYIFLIRMKVRVSVLICVYVFCIQEKLNKKSQ